MPVCPAQCRIAYGALRLRGPPCAAGRGPTGPTRADSKTMTPDPDLRESLLGPYLTTITTHTEGDEALCGSLIRLRLKANEPDLIPRLCALIEDASRVYEQDHLGTGTNDHLCVFEAWLQQRMWITAQIGASAGDRGVVTREDGATSTAAEAFSNLLRRTRQLQSSASDERAQVGLDHRASVFRPIALGHRAKPPHE